MSRYQFIEQLAATEPVQVLCRILEVSAASYHQWRNRVARPTPSWEPAATAAFSRHAQRYGTRRLRADYAPKDTPLGATRCAAGYVVAACGRSAPGPSAFALLWLTPRQS